MTTVIETRKWKIKIYSPPREHGSPHVHVISKGEKAEVRIYLENLEVTGEKKFQKVGKRDNPIHSFKLSGLI